MQQFLGAIGRNMAVVNLDPANDALPYECAVDVSELITLADVMEAHGLGPNGGLVYCVEYLIENLDWLKGKLKALGNTYVVFDCPGQVELYTHHKGMRKLISALQSWGFQMCVVHLVDSHHCSDPAKFVSVLMVSLASMCHLEMPHVNILSKVDLIEQYGTLPFGLEFFSDVLDLNYLLEHLESDPFAGRFSKLNRGICELIENYNQVAFSTLNIQDKHSVDKVLKIVDKANGYIWGEMERKKRAKDLLYNLDAVRNTSELDYSRTMQVQEEYMREFSSTDTVRPTLPDENKVSIPIPVPAGQNDQNQKGVAQKVCSNCMNKAGSLKCGECRMANYCSRECQRAHWQQHKKMCQQTGKDTLEICR